MSRLRPTDVEFARPEGVEERSVVSVFRVPPELAGQRLDVFLQGQLRRTSRTRAQHIVRMSAYSAEGRPLRTNHRVREFELVLLWRAPWDEKPVPTDVPILYEDEHLLAVDKPALLPVHPTARYYHNTLIRVLTRDRPGEFLSLGHRLDRETSGVLLVSKTSACDRALKRALEERTGIEKTYVAITWGVPSKDEAARVGGRVTSAPEGPDAFRFERSLELDVDSSYGVKMRLGKTDGALSASTRFLVCEARGPSSTRYARVQCMLETGRQHQIRLHLASLGAPIVGDKLYGPDETCFARGADDELTLDDLERLELPRHALHAAKLSLDHPVTGAPLEIEAPFPEDLHAFWDTLSPIGG